MILPVDSAPVPGNIDQRLIAVVKRCMQNGRHEDWLEFVHLAQPLIAAKIYRTLNHDATRELVDDLVQDTFVRLSRDNYAALRRLLESPDHPAAYLRTVAFNATCDYLRREKHEESLEDSVSENFEDQTATRGVERALLFRQLDEHVQAIATPRDRAVFWLHHRDGLTAIRIADMTQLSRDAVTKVLQRTLRKLRDRLGAPKSRGAALG